MVFAESKRAARPRSPALLAVLAALLAWGLLSGAAQAAQSPPEFSGSSATLRVPENLPAGTKVGAPVTATDPEGDKVTYSITGANPGGFTVDSGSGQIRNGQPLDHESASSYTITLQATAAGGSGTVPVTINVTDVNEAPAFPADTATRSVAENSPGGAGVGDPVTATDPDEGDTLIYTMPGGQGLFTTGKSSGRIRVASGADLDHESASSHTVTVRATDSRGLYGTISVTINVTDVDEDPEFGSSGYTRRAAEDAAAGTSLGSPITATDPQSQTLTYSLSGTGSGNFKVGASSGRVRVASGASLDHETVSSYTLTIRAQDPDGNAGTAALTIDVTNVNEAPVFPADTATRSVAENSPGGTGVGDPVTATDPDSGSALTYTMVGGQGLFTTGASNGRIRVASGADLDYESATSHTVTVRATDSRGLYDTVSVTINVTNVVEASMSGPQPTLSVSFSPSPDEPQGTELTVRVELGGLPAEAASGISFRLDVESADPCEGEGMGASRGMPIIDEDPEVRTATIPGTCHAGFHTLQVRVHDGDELWVSSDREFALRSPGRPEAPTPIPGGRAAAAGPAYLGTVHIVVGGSGNTYGYLANDYGGLTAGQLPAALFTDGRARPAGGIMDSGSQLELRYADTEAGLFRDPGGLRWLRVQLRGEDNAVIGGANLWDAAPCGGQGICLGVGGMLAAHDAGAVGVDFFDAAAEALDSAPGGLKNILIVAGATGATGTGLDPDHGDWVGGGFPKEWFYDGYGKPVERVTLWHGTTNRRIELAYAASETTGRWKYTPSAYRKHRLVLRDRDGEKVLELPVRDALAAMSEDARRCGDANAARRLCLAYHDHGLDPRAYRGQVMLLQVEDVTWYAMLTATPGGATGGQLMLGLLGAGMFGWRFRSARSPQREWSVLAAGAVSSALLPVFGFGSLFWPGAILIIAVLSGAGWFFITRSR